MQPNPDWLKKSLKESFTFCVVYFLRLKLLFLISKYYFYLFKFQSLVNIHSDIFPEIISTFWALKTFLRSEINISLCDKYITLIKTCWKLAKINLRITFKFSNKDLEFEFLTINRYLLINQFLANVPILYTLKTWERLWFFGVFRGYKMGTLMS